MRYRSKKDWWLFGLVWATPPALVAAGLCLVLAPGGSPEAGWRLVRAGVILATVLFLLTYPLDYEITDEQLVARCGVIMRWRVPLASIEEVSPTRDPASAPTWSLDRLRVDYRSTGQLKTLLVSPADKDGFMRELAARAQGLELRDGRVVRAA